MLRSYFGCARVAIAPAQSTVFARRRSSIIFIFGLRMCLLGAAAISIAARADAIQVSLISATLAADNTPSGVFVTPGAGTAAWDSQLTTLSSGGTAPNVVGASASAETRYAFAISSVASGNAKNTLITQTHYTVTYQVVNDDPLHDDAFTATLHSSSSGPFLTIGSVFGLAQYRYEHPALMIGNGGFGPGYSYIGGGGGGGTGSIPLGSWTGSIHGQFTPATEVQTFTFDIIWTNTASADKASGVIALAGLDTGLNPVIGAEQHYPSFGPYTDPPADGQFLTFSVTHVPEPSSMLLVAIGGFSLISREYRRRSVR